MTTPETERTPAEPAAPGTPPTEPAVPSRSYAPLFLKGCGFSLLAVALGVGVLVASKGDFAAIGSALFGVVFLLLILSSSGLTGFWDDKP
jgi:hypothetical protein